jgi:hypothetical protein
MNKSVERFLAFGFGIVFVVVLIILAIRFPNPTPFQYTVFRIVLALAAGGVAGMIPGFLTVEISKWLRAGGALAVFVIVYFYSPAGLTGVKVKTDQDLEIEKPIVRLYGEGEQNVAVLQLARVVHAQSTSTLPDLNVTHVDQLLSPEVWNKHYQTLTVDGVRAQVPDRATLVANEITGINGGTMVGSDFSIVARHMANMQIDVSGSRSPGALPGSVRLYVKLIENSRVFANGAPGSPGPTGAPGANGGDGLKGRDADCAGFGGYHGANPGGNGGDAANGNPGQAGGNGQDGGLVVVTTIVNPVGCIFDVSGGKPGPGGAGGPPGTPGRAGSGGRGCTGLGGTAQNEADGQPGRAGQPGSNGLPGVAGKDGEYRLQIIKTFDQIVYKVKTLPDAQLHDALQKP